MNSIFIQLAIILTLICSLGFITYRLKLPLLIAYLVGGLLLAAAATFDISKSYVFSFLPDIGIAFVLFLVGMELDLRELKSFGKQIITAGLLQVIISATLGTYIAQSFGFKLPEAIYLGVGLSFSSTLVVVKLLLDRKDLTSLYGKLSIGVLLLEDLLAVIILLVMTSGTKVNSSNLAFVFLLKIILLFGAAIGINRFILTPIFKAVSSSGELLFLTVLAWCFGFISLAGALGFSVLIGAFLAGVVLASSPYHYHIQGKITPMRDFFVALFFVYLGTRVNFTEVSTLAPLIVIFALYAVLVKPLIFLLLFGIFGFRKHTMFKTAINLSQISEFSLIILLIGLNLKVISQSALSVIALSSVISFIVSSVMISQANRIYKFSAVVIAFFERKRTYLKESESENKLSDHIVVIGAHRVGGEVVRFLKREKRSLVVLDFNPAQVEALLSVDIPVIYGDMGDPEVLDILSLPRAKLIISTCPDLADNKTLLEDLKLRHIFAPTIVRAETIKEAKILYKLGADFVIVPDILAGDVLLNILREHLDDKGFFNDRPRIELEKLSHKILAWE